MFDYYKIKDSRNVIAPISHCNPCCNFCKAFYNVRALQNVFLLLMMLNNRKLNC